MPKLATKVVQWLDIQKDDHILDIGCGDGVLDVEFGRVLAEGSGSLHGVDSSPAMIDAARKAVGDAGLQKCTFDGKFSPLLRLLHKPFLEHSRGWNID